MKELLSCGMRVLERIPTRLVEGFPLVDGLFFPLCLYVDKDTGFLWDLIAHHCDSKGDLKVKSFSLCIQN